MSISVFVDGANFFFMQKKGLNWFADPKKLLSYLEKTYGDIADAFYYIGKDAPPDSRQQGFLDALPDMGFSVVTKQIKTIYDPETGETKKKANLDIEIVLDMFNTIDLYDTAVLVSGDGDFDRALQLLKARGKKFIVVSTKKFIAGELRATAGSHYIDLSDLEAEIKSKIESVVETWTFMIWLWIVKFMIVQAFSLVATAVAVEKAGCDALKGLTGTNSMYPAECRLRFLFRFILSPHYHR